MEHVRVRHCAYSVPSRLIGRGSGARVYEDRIEMYYAGGDPQLSVERLHGRNGHRIDYRHVIGSLVRKPGAFARYRYREELFPDARLPPGLRRSRGGPDELEGGHGVLAGPPLGGDDDGI